MIDPKISPTSLAQVSNSSSDRLFLSFKVQRVAVETLESLGQLFTQCRLLAYCASSLRIRSIFMLDFPGPIEFCCWNNA